MPLARATSSPSEAGVGSGTELTVAPRSSRLPGLRTSATGNRRGSADAEQVHHEDQRLAGLDHAAGATVAVRQVGRDDQLAAAPDLHALDAGVPARDDLADA